MLLSMPYSVASIHEFDHQSQPSSIMHMQMEMNMKIDMNQSSNVKQHHRQTVINGSKPQQNKYQYASSLQIEALGESHHICGASLIAPDIILTAAHCFKDGTLTVVVGEYNLVDDGDSGKVFDVEQIEVHPDFLETSQYVENDVMVLKILGRSERNIVKLNYNRSLPVLHTDINIQNTNMNMNMNIGESPSSNVDNHDALTVMGWGSLNDIGTHMSNALREVQLGYISNQDCMQRGIPVVTNQMMCAVDLDGDSVTEDSCYGDSGGPIILTDSTIASMGKDVQVGIVSFGAEMCGIYPGVYTRISSVYGWIKQRVCELSTDAPDYFRCADIPIPTAISNDIGMDGYIDADFDADFDADADNKKRVPFVAPTRSNLATGPPSFIMSSHPTMIPLSTSIPTNAPSLSPTKTSMSPSTSPSTSKSIYEPLPSPSMPSNVNRDGNEIGPTKEHENEPKPKLEKGNQPHSSPVEENENEEENGDEEETYDHDRPEAVDVLLGTASASKDKNSASFHLENVGFFPFFLSIGAYFIMR